MENKQNFACLQHDFFTKSKVTMLDHMIAKHFDEVDICFCCGKRKENEEEIE